jgi:hypothetical protein
MKPLTLVWLVAAVIVEAAVRTGGHARQGVTIYREWRAGQAARLSNSKHTGTTGPEIVATRACRTRLAAFSREMRADSAGVPSRYVIEVKEGQSVEERVDGSVFRGRVSARLKNSRGESANEFVVSPGALVIDDDVFHQYYFITRRQSPVGPVSVIVPRRNTQVTIRVADGGTEKLTIGGSTLDARRFTIADPGGTNREVWADTAGRLLKVAIPSKGVVALRDDPPR